MFYIDNHTSLLFAAVYYGFYKLAVPMPSTSLVVLNNTNSHNIQRTLSEQQHRSLVGVTLKDIGNRSKYCVDKG